MTLEFRAGLLAAIGLCTVSGGIQAAEYTRDPCIASADESVEVKAIKAIEERRGESFQQQAQMLTDRGRALDGATRAFNSRCDIDLEEGSPGEIACAKEKPTRLAELTEQNGAVRSFNDEVASFIDQALSTLERRLAGTRAELIKGQHNTDEWAADAQRWIDMQEDARARARDQAVEIVIGEVIGKFQEKLDAERLLSEGELKTGRAWAARVGRVFPASVAKELQTRAQNLRAGRDVITMLNYIYDQHVTAYMVIDATKGETTVAETMVELVASFPLGPQVAPNIRKAAEIILLVEKDAVAGLASWIIKGRLNELTALQENQLATMNRFSALYVELVKAKKTLPQVRERCLAP